MHIKSNKTMLLKQKKLIFYVKIKTKIDYNGIRKVSTGWVNQLELSFSILSSCLPWSFFPNKL